VARSRMMKNLLKYGFTGAVASIVDFGLFAALVRLAHWPWFISGCISFSLSVLAGYLISIRLVFVSGERFRKHEEIALVFVVSLFGLAINQGLLYVLIHAGLDPIGAKLGASVFVISWNFLARSRLVFKIREN
jgi:putative flippase GtrA